MEVEEINFTNINSEYQDIDREYIFKQNEFQDYFDSDQTNANNKKESESSQSNLEMKPVNKQMNKVQIRNKNKYKQVEFSYVNIPAQNILVNQEFFYTHGDIVIDFQKKNYSFDNRYSSWNICKIWPVTQINKDAGIFAVNMENKFRPDFNYTHNQIQKYKDYPDQQIHNLMENLEKFAAISKFLNQFLEQYFSVIRQNPAMLNQYYQRKSRFDQYMDSIYKKLNEQGTIFFSSHSGPDIENNDFLFYKCVFSESLSQILGKTMEELQDMFRRNGAYDFFDFEAQLEIYQIMIREQVKIFEQYQIGNHQIKKEKVYFPKQFKLMTYDDIVFYTDVCMVMYKMSDFTNDTGHSIDFYAGIIQYEISPSTLKQIISIRQQNNEDNNLAQTNESAKSIYQENFEYTIQAEIFKEKFIDDLQSKDINRYGKTCNYKTK